MGAAIRRCLAGESSERVCADLVKHIDEQRVKSANIFDEAARDMNACEGKLQDLRSEMRAVAMRCKSLRQNQIPKELQTIHKYQLMRIIDIKRSAQTRMARSVQQQGELDRMMTQVNQASTLDEFTLLRQKFANAGKAAVPSQKRIKRAGADVETVVNLIQDASEDSAETTEVFGTASDEAFDASAQVTDVYAEEFDNLMREVFNDAREEDVEEEIGMGSQSGRLAPMSIAREDVVPSAAAAAVSQLRRAAVARA